LFCTNLPVIFFVSLLVARGTQHMMYLDVPVLAVRRQLLY